jgi:hypothetical protein
MKSAVLGTLVGVALAFPALSAESVVLGKGISNVYAAPVTCPENSLCMDSTFLWVFRAKTTVSGPVIKGTIRVVASQHVDARTTFVKSVELFVVRPIEDAAVRKEFGAEFYLVSLSPRYKGDKYCLTVNPNDVGLKLPIAQVAFDSDSGVYCFNRKLLKL